MEHFPLTRKIHTDVLESKYGKIHANVLKHTSRMRICHLEDKENISRTFAITFFPFFGHWGHIKSVDREIQAGGAIGKTFRKHGFVIRKNVLDVYPIELSEALRSAFQTKEHHAKARLSEFYAKRGHEEPVVYGVVVEIYTPDFRSAHINRTDMRQVGLSTKALKKAGFSLNQVWEMLGENTRWDEVRSKHRKEAKISDKYVVNLKYKVRKGIHSLR